LLVFNALAIGSLPQFSPLSSLVGYFCRAGLEYRISHYAAQPSLELLVDPENLPSEYVEVEYKTIYKPQTDKMKAALKAGGTSVHKFARLGEATQVLKISKPKQEKEETEE
jgi:hypothetical protein